MNWKSILTGLAVAIVVIGGCTLAMFASGVPWGTPKAGELLTKALTAGACFGVIAALFVED